MLFVILVVGGCLVWAASTGATPPPLSEWKVVYWNPLRTEAQRAEIKTPSPACECRRMAGDREFKFRMLDRGRMACMFDAPAAGEDLVASIEGKLFGSTPKSIQRKTYLALAIRSKRFGVRYRVRVYPRTGRFVISAERKGRPGSERKDYSTIVGTDPNQKNPQISGIDRNHIQGVGKTMRFGLRIYSGKWGVPASRVRVVVLLEGRAIAAFGVPWPRMDRGSITFGAGRSGGGSSQGITASFRDLKVTRAVD
jgi:hypothetical protein